MSEFADKSALVVGGSSGVGRAVAMAFAGSGANVVVAARGLSRAEEVVALIREQGGCAVACAGDVGRDADVKRFVDTAVERYSRLDVACNCAGIVGNVGPITEQSEEMFDSLMRTNAKGVWLCVKHEVTAMLRSGGGAIVNVSSVTGLIGVAGVSGYVASKHAVHGITKAVALEVAKQGVRVNAVAPACVDTELFREFCGELEMQGVEDAAARMAASHPVGRIARPEEIASAVLWLCSPGASFTTGLVLTVDGGQTVG